MVGFRFLDLPSEPRNGVYKFAVSANDHEQLVSKDRPMEPQKSTWNLIRTCHQLREEFRPICNAHMRFNLLPQHVDSFVAAFYPLASQHTHTGHGTVWLTLPSQRSNPEFNVLPFLRFVLNAGNIHYAIRPGTILLRLILDTHSSAWKAILNDEYLRQLPIYWNWDRCATFEFRRRVPEPWMKDASSDQAVSSERKHQWLSNVGFRRGFHDEFRMQWEA